MGALAAAAQINRKDGEIIQHKCAVDTIYQGGLVKLNAAGFAAPCAAEVGAVFAGVAVETMACESPLAAGDKSVRVYKKGVFLLEAASSIFSQTTVGQRVYATDDNNITLTNSADLQCAGVIVEHESGTKAWVKIDGAVGVLGGNLAHIADVATTAATTSTPYGYAQAQADAIVADINAILVVLRKHKMISEA